MSAGTRADDAGAPPGESSTGLLLYGVVGADAGPPPGLTGVGGAPVESVPVDTVAALVSEMPLDRPPGRRAELVAFQQLVDTVAGSVAVAPARFGTVLPDEAAVVEFLQAEEEELERLLAMLAGRRQYHLRATYVEDVVLAELVAQDPEVRELRELTRDVPEDVSYGDRVRLGELVAHGLAERSAQDAELLAEWVYPHAVAHVDRGGADPSVVLDVALLVDESHGEAFLESLETLAEAVHERIRMRLVGPTAAYDFAGEW